MHWKLDLSRPVRLVNPEPGEEKLVFEVMNYNEVTQPVYIAPLNLGSSLRPQELVSIDDIENVEEQ